MSYNNQKKRILFIGVTSAATVNFRLHLFKKLISDGFELSVICSDETKRTEIENAGVHFYCVPFDNRSINIFSFGKITRFFRKTIREVNPDIVFTYQLKGNIFGSKAANLEKKPFIVLNEGLGDGFGNSYSLKGRIIKKASVHLHKKYIKNAFSLIVLNKDDASFFVENNICNKEQLRIINGVGVDCDKFSFCELPSDFAVLDVSRLVRTKGVLDYCEIARIVRKKDNTIEFHLVGPEVDVTKSEIETYINSGDVIYHGFTNDVKQYIKKASVVVLPSYREGFGLSLVEGGAMGRPAIAYDVTGPNAFVINGETGFLVPFKDYDAFAERILFLKENETVLKKMSIASREHVVNYCDVNVIDKTIENIINACINSNK